MSISNKKLPLEGNASLLEKMAGDYAKLVDVGAKKIPQQRVYKIACAIEDASVNRSARKAALKNMQGGFKKVAFDTRRVDQETTRNPRANLQYWNRSQQFIGEDEQRKIEIFTKLMEPLKEIKAAYGDQPEYFESYSRVLYDHVERVLRLKLADQDIHASQLAYLEQLMFARYRLSMEELAKMSSSDLKRKILDKDEALIRRGAYLAATSGEEQTKQAQLSFKSGDAANTQESIVNAIFGNNKLRRDGEKTVERTITITIRDEVID